MRKFLEYVVGQLIDRPDELVIHSEQAENKEHRFTLELARSEVGKVIGKQGHTIRAIRNLLSSTASRHGEIATLEIRERPEG